MWNPLHRNHLNDNPNVRIIIRIIIRISCIIVRIWAQKKGFRIRNPLHCKHLNDILTIRIIIRIIVRIIRTIYWLFLR